MRVLLALPFCAMTLIQSVHAEEHVVTMAGSNYMPASLTVNVGDTIRFVNNDSENHTVFIPEATYAVDLGTQKPGAETVMLVRRSGTFEVECVWHGDMVMQLDVTQ